VHLICDNYGTHKTPAIVKWLAAHPRFHVHYTQQLDSRPPGETSFTPNPPSNSQQPDCNSSNLPGAIPVEP
jgi:hypothetical protein